MTFPSFIQTGPARDIQTAPIEYKPFNLLPLIQLMKEESTKVKTTEGTTKKEEPKLEGRIGGVNQIMARVNYFDRQIKQGLDLVGPAFTSTPEYAAAVRGRDESINPRVENVLNRQSEDVKRYKEATKQKGSYYDLNAWAAGRDLKLASDWTNILERGESVEFYGDGTGTFLEDFDFDPPLYGLNDATAEIDRIYGPTGYTSTGGGGGDIIETAVGDIAGFKTTYEEEHFKRNFSTEFDSKNWSGKMAQLENSLNQTISQAFGKNIDLTNKISHGLWQGFFQSRSGDKKNPLKDYYKVENNQLLFDSDKMFNDFKSYAKKELDAHYEKRKIFDYSKTTKESFNEVSDNWYANDRAKKDAEILSGAWQSMNESVAADDDYGTPFDNLFMPGNTLSIMNVTHGYKDFNEDDIYYQITKSKDNPFAPFVKRFVNGTMFIDKNEDYDAEKHKESVKNFIKTKTRAHGGTNTQEKQDAFTNDLLAKTDKYLEQFKDLEKKGSTTKGITSKITSPFVMPSQSVPPWFLEILNSKDLVDKNIIDYGVNIPAKIGEGYIILGKGNPKGGAKYIGSGGALKMNQNVLPTNIYTTIQDANGKFVQYRWDSPQWRGLPDEEKDKIVELAKTQQSTIPGTGTEFKEIDGKRTDKVKRDRAVYMDPWSEKFLAKYADDPTNTISSIYASPGALYMPNTFWAASETELAKSFEGQSIPVEMPSSYAVNPAFKNDYSTEYDKVYVASETKHSVHQSVLNRINKGDKNEDLHRGPVSTILVIDPKKYTKEKWLDEIDIPNEYKDDFYAKFNELPKGQTNDFYNRWITSYKLDRKYNVSNQDNPVLTNVPIVVNGKINPILHDAMSYRQQAYGEKGKEVPGFSVTFDVDVTAAIMNGVKDPAVSTLRDNWLKNTRIKYNNQILGQGAAGPTDIKNSGVNGVIKKNKTN